MSTENLAVFGGGAGALAAATGVQLAQGGAAIGSVTGLVGQVTIVRATGERVAAGIGTEVYQNDLFETGAGSGVGLTFADGSSFSLGADAQLTIDSFVYDPGADSTMVMNLAQGAFAFVSGQISKTGDNSMTIVTPTATIGIRGTAGAGDEDEAVLLQEPGQQLGEMTVTTQGGTVTLAQPNAYTNTSNPFAAPSSPILRPLSDIQSLFGSALRQLPVQLPANENLPPNPDDSGSNEQGEGQGNSDTARADAQPGEGGDGSEGGEADAIIEGLEETPITAENAVAEELQPQTEADGTGNDTDVSSPATFTLVAKLGGAVAPPPAPTSVSVAPPPVIKVPTAPTVTPPATPPPVIVAPSVGPAPNIPTNTITVNSSTTITLSSGVSETVQISGSELTVTVLGRAESGDSFIDISNSGLQGIFFSTVASHTFAVNGIENVTFGNLTSAETQTISIGGTGPVIFNSTSGPFNANITGDSNNNTFNIGAGISAPSTINAAMGAGTDTVNVNASVQVTLGLSGVEFVSSTNAANQNLVFSNAVSGVTVDLGAGLDSLTLGNGGNSITLSNVENLFGGSGSDHIVMASAILSGSFFDAGAGSLDMLTLKAGSTNTGSLVNFEFVMGVAGTAEHLTLEHTVDGTIFEFGELSDGDSLQLADGGNILVANKIATILGGDGDDVIGYLGATSNVFIDGGEGIDSVVNVTGGASFFTLSNIELYVGQEDANDTVTLQTLMQSGDFFYGGGSNDNDVLNLAGGSNTGSITLFEFVNGTAVDDDLTLETPIGLTSVQIDLGGGTDTLTLSDGGNTATIKNVEFVFGGADSDHITVAGGVGATFVLGAGGDTATGAVGATDIFTYIDPIDAGIGEGETITNFEIGLDFIDVSGFAQGSFIFIGGAGFTANSGFVQGRFSDANTLQFDSDDDGIADMEITLSNGVATSLTSSDFIDSAYSV